MGLFDKLARKTAEAGTEPAPGITPSTRPTGVSVSNDAPATQALVHQLPPPTRTPDRSPPPPARFAAPTTPPLAGPAFAGVPTSRASSTNPLSPNLASQTTGPAYDPTQPGQTPVAGIDLITFAEVSRRLMELPVDDQPALLDRYGHSPESWNAVNTAWMARLGQMPFLYTTYSEAFRSR